MRKGLIFVAIGLCLAAFITGAVLGFFLFAAAGGLLFAAFRFAK
ncbi:hypothetical protein RvVAR031_36350 [Agrobacterium vitis]|nr:hypothetical protein [Agrobacterium vitis]BCH56025.1 hypothetical protein RvVAR031_36350 [Agrobacterium vitis]